MERRNSKPTLSELEGGLLIDEHALDEALAQQSDLFYQVGRELEDLISLRDQAETELEETRAQADIGIRSRARKRDEKYAEGEIKSRIALDDKVQAANKKYLDLKNKCGRYTRLEKAFEQRSRALGKLVDLYTAGYFTDVTHRSQTNSMKDHKATNIRQRMNIERQRRNEEA